MYNNLCFFKCIGDVSFDVNWVVNGNINILIYENYKLNLIKYINGNKNVNLVQWRDWEYLLGWTGFFLNLIYFSKCLFYTDQIMEIIIIERNIIELVSCDSSKEKTHKLSNLSRNFLLSLLI